MRYWVNCPQRDSDHKPLYNVEKTSAVLIPSLYMSVPGIK